MIDPNFTVKQGDDLDQAIRDGNRLADALVKSREEVLRYKTALEEIAKGAGPYSRDPLEHASNTIDAMKSIAVEALQGKSD
jgi:hypothetical protein